MIEIVLRVGCLVYAVLAGIVIGGLGAVAKGMMETARHEGEETYE